MLISQQKQKDNGQTFLGEKLGSAVLDSGASATNCGTKWFDCFLETVPVQQQKNKCPRRTKKLQVQ